MRRITREEQRVSIAMADVAVELERLQEGYRLTNVQMLSAVAVWQARKLRYIAAVEGL